MSDDDTRTTTISATATTDDANAEKPPEEVTEKKAHRMAALFEGGPLMGMAPPSGFMKHRKRQSADTTTTTTTATEDASESKESLTVSDAKVTKNLEDEEIAGISMLYKEGERGRSKSRAHLESMNVLPPNSGTVAPALSGVQMELDRKMKKDRLEALYSDRPERDDVEPQVFTTSKAPPPLPPGTKGRISMAGKTAPPPVPAAAVAKLRASITHQSTADETPAAQPVKRKAEKPKPPVVVKKPVEVAKKPPAEKPKQRQQPQRDSVAVENLSSLDFPELSRHRVASMQETQAGMPGLLELVHMMQVRLTTLQHEQAQLVGVNSQLRQEIKTLQGYTSRFSMQDLEALLGSSSLSKRANDIEQKKKQRQQRESVIVAPAEMFLQTGGDRGIKTVFYQGWLMKEGSWGSWKRRYFCIYEDRVEYYASPNDTLKASESLHFGKLLCAITPMKKRKGVKKECMELAFDDGRKQKCWRFYVAGDDDHSIANQWLKQFQNRIAHMEYLRTCLLNHQIPDVRLLKFFNSQLHGGATPLSLRDQPLSFYTVRAISNVLGDPDFPCRPLAELDVANAGMCPEEVVLLGSSYAECLKTNRKHFPAATLKKLDMSGNTVGAGEGIKEFSSALRLGHSLRHLTLHKCELGDGGAVALAEVLEYTQLVRLGLSRNHIGDKGTQALARAIRSGKNQIGAANRPTVSMKDRVLLESEASVSRASDNVRRSNADEAPPSLEDIERETKHCLTHLDLSYNDISEAGGVALGEMLSCVTRIEKFYLQNNQLNDTAVVAIATGIRKNSYIRVIDLSMNTFQHDGGAALTHMAQMNRSLSEAHFMGHHLHKNALTALRMCAEASD